MNRNISKDGRVILDMIAEKGMDFIGIKEGLVSSDINLMDEEILFVIGELKDTGLLLNSNGFYSVTLLGALASGGMDDVYKSISRREDLHDFFRTRIPGTIPIDLLKKFKINEDFIVIGRSDGRERVTFIMNEALSLAPTVEKEMIIVSDLLYRPSLMYLVSGLAKRPKIRLLFSSLNFKKENIFMKIVQRFTNSETMILEDEYLHIGMFCIDDRACVFGFRNMKDVPGWDAVIYTEDDDCISWVKENFVYLWDNFAKKPSKIGA
ncbi:MAG: hypothetical protein SVM80_03040 [Halobacteriota archaeon]|nr:hypothetical protein [Halobacteriota archaeon]